jgi:23S rRNA (guanosine2251-2'-O)-methyltransferase
VLAQVGPRRFEALEELLPGDTAAFVVMLDGIEDPYNFGQAVRSLYAAGADGVVVPARNWMSAAGVVARASAGASELCALAQTGSAEEAAAFFRGRGLTVACAVGRHGTTIYDADLTVPLFLLIGGERRGITRSFLERADVVLQVPYGRAFGASLTAASVSAVIAFEVLRQRSCAPPTVD